MKNIRYTLEQPINPYYEPNATNEIMHIINQLEFKPMNVNGENVFVKNAENPIIFASALKIEFDGTKYIVQAWMYGSNFWGTKRDYKKEKGLKGMMGYLWKDLHKKNAQTIIEIAQKYNCY